MIIYFWEKCLNSILDGLLVHLHRMDIIMIWFFWNNENLYSRYILIYFLKNVSMKLIRYIISYGVWNQIYYIYHTVWRNLERTHVSQTKLGFSMFCSRFCKIIVKDDSQIALEAIVNNAEYLPLTPFSIVDVPLPFTRDLLTVGFSPFYCHSRTTDWFFPLFPLLEISLMPNKQTHTPSHCRS